VSRVDRLRERLEAPFLVSNPINVRYLSGFVSTNAALLVEPERVTLFTDFRYLEAAQAVEGVEVVETRRDLFGHLAELLPERVAFEADHLTYARAEGLAGGRELAPTRGVVEELRELKDDGELDSVRRAAELTNHMFGELAEQQFVGRTERELSIWIETRFLGLGADAVGFAHVAAGANGALPHGKPGDRVIPSGTTVVVDAGCVVDGYSSDCTRTFLTGEPPDEVRRAYDVCLEAQLAGLDATRAGRPGVEVDRVARDLIEAAGLGGFFGHGLGHGVGLEVHEGPYLNQESTGTVAPGNVLTVEPGIYLPGLAGVRIEDLVVVTETGLDVLTSFPKEPTTVR
jgi:Xaa-Pro aminopeptidase